MAAKSAARRIGWNPTPQGQKEPLPHWRAGYEPPEIDIPAEYEARLERQCVKRADKVIVQIRRAMHHTLREVPEIQYLDLMKMWAKQTKRELHQVVTQMGTEEQLLSPCGCETDSRYLEDLL